MKKNKINEIWLHAPTFTIALVQGQHGEFYFNGQLEESYWTVFRMEPGEVHGWFYIGDL